MKRSIIAGGLLGLILFSGLIVWYGVGEIAQTLAVIGWGFLAVCLFRWAILVFDLLSWRVLLTQETRQSFGRLFWIRWVADSVNTLLPVARVGGEFLRAHLLYRRGVGGAAAAASVLVDVTAGVFAQLVFSIIGVIAFVVLIGTDQDTSVNLALGLALFGLGVGGLIVVQRAGVFSVFARLASSMADGSAWSKLTGAAEAFDSATGDLYRKRLPFTLCCLWRIVGWVAGTGEVWLVLYFLGHPVTLAEAFILESLGQAARSAGFMVPGGIGIQEGGLILIGGHLGLTPEVALALSLAKRGRELAIGVPCLLVWQFLEGYGLLEQDGRL